MLSRGGDFREGERRGRRKLLHLLEEVLCGFALAKQCLEGHGGLLHSRIWPKQGLPKADRALVESLKAHDGYAKLGTHTKHTTKEVLVALVGLVDGLPHTLDFRARFLNPLCRDLRYKLRRCNTHLSTSSLDDLLCLNFGCHRNECAITPPHRLL